MEDFGEGGGNGDGDGYGKGCRGGNAVMGGRDMVSKDNGMSREKMQGGDIQGGVNPHGLIIEERVCYDKR